MKSQGSQWRGRKTVGKAKGNDWLCDQMEIDHQDSQVSVLDIKLFRLVQVVFWWHLKNGSHNERRSKEEEKSLSVKNLYEWNIWSIFPAWLATQFKIVVKKSKTTFVKLNITKHNRVYFSNVDRQLWEGLDKSTV